MEICKSSKFLLCPECMDIKRKEYIDYLDGRMSAPMEKFTIRELTEPFLSYEEFSGRKEKEREERRKREEMEKKKEHDDAYYDWSSRCHERIMEALDKHYFSTWFKQYSQYLYAEREKARAEYSLEQLRQPVVSYEEFVAEKERERSGKGTEDIKKENDVGKKMEKASFGMSEKDVTERVQDTAESTVSQERKKETAEPVNISATTAGQEHGKHGAEDFWKCGAAWRNQRSRVPAV